MYKNQSQFIHPSMPKPMKSPVPISQLKSGGPSDQIRASIINMTSPITKQLLNSLSLKHNSLQSIYNRARKSPLLLKAPIKVGKKYRSLLTVTHDHLELGVCLSCLAIAVFDRGMTACYTVMDDVIDIV